MRGFQSGAQISKEGPVQCSMKQPAIQNASDSCENLKPGRVMPSADFMIFKRCT